MEEAEGGFSYSIPIILSREPASLYYQCNIKKQLNEKQIQAFWLFFAMFHVFLLFDPEVMVCMSLVT